MAILVKSEYVRKETVRVIVYVYDDDNPTAGDSPTAPDAPTATAQRKPRVQAI